jgi:LysM repeat protein
MGVDRQSSLRALAPASLVAFAVVLLIVVIASLSSGGDSSSSSKQSEGVRTTQKKDASRPATRKRTRPRRFYTVKPGDNLAMIAEQTGVSLEELRALNPTLDPQGLVSGQRVKLPAPQ